VLSWYQAAKPAQHPSPVSPHICARLGQARGKCPPQPRRLGTASTQHRVEDRDGNRCCRPRHFMAADQPARSHCFLESKPTNADFSDMSGSHNPATGGSPAFLPTSTGPRLGPNCYSNHKQHPSWTTSPAPYGMGPADKEHAMVVVIRSRSHNERAATFDCA
jgi:hypothetical protein